MLQWFVLTRYRCQPTQMFHFIRYNVPCGQKEAYCVCFVFSVALNGSPRSSSAGRCPFVFYWLITATGSGQRYRMQDHPELTFMPPHMLVRTQYLVLSAGQLFKPVYKLRLSGLPGEGYRLFFAVIWVLFSWTIKYLMMMNLDYLCSR